MSLSAITCGLLSTLLPVVWKGENGWTYTLQHSLDMLEWQSVPSVICGDGSWESVLLELEGSPVFARWRSSPSGDTNDNGLPDQWEWEAFGMLDIDPEADPDLDGLSNFDEWSAGTDPLDFFNGKTAILTITCGREWLVASGELSAQQVSLIVKGEDGIPFAGAPVILRLPEGLGKLRSADGTESDQLVINTDSLGRIHPGLASVHYVAPASGPSEEFLEISTGDQHQSILMRIISGTVEGPPRAFTSTPQQDGSVTFEWTGSADEATAFIIEKQSPYGEWTLVTELAVDALPEMDPETGRFSLNIEAPVLQ